MYSNPEGAEKWIERVTSTVVPGGFVDGIFLDGLPAPSWSCGVETFFGQHVILLTPIFFAKTGSGQTWEMLNKGVFTGACNNPALNSSCSKAATAAYSAGFNKTVRELARRLGPNATIIANGVVTEEYKSIATGWMVLRPPWVPILKILRTIYQDRLGTK
jgi:hypothetical protein|eukprot:COSAG06_NODE_4797_length_3947_cov_1.454782_4_plen_160_part_00